MNKQLRFLFTALMAVFVSGVSYADTKDISLVETTKTDNIIIVENSPITVTFEANGSSLGNNQSNNRGIRFYGGNKMTITAATGYVVTSFTLTSNKNGNSVNSISNTVNGASWANGFNTGKQETYTWTNNDNTTNPVVLETSGSSGNVYLSAISVTYKTAVDDGKSDITISYSSNIFTAIIGETNNYPSLTVDPSGLTISYSSSVPEVASVDNNGNVTLNSEGTTVISASFAGNNSYRPATASYTLNVEEPSVPLEAVTNAVWDFSSFTSKSYTSTKTVNNIEIGAGCAIDRSVLKFGGSGSATGRYVHFKVAGAIKITVVASHASSSGDPRDLMISFGGVKENAEKVGSVEAGATAATFIFEYEGDNEDIYLYSANSGINLSSITVEPLETGAPLTAVYEPSEITLEQGEAFTAPTLSITDANGGPVEGLTIIYSSSNTDVAAVDAATGEISLGTATGEAVITAEIDGGETYRSTSATVTIVVNAKSINAVTDKFWKFDEWTSGDMTTTTVNDDLEFITSTATGKISESNATIDGEEFTTRFQFSGKSNVGKLDRILHFKVADNCNITIYIRGNGSDRYVNLVKGTLSENYVAQAEADKNKSFTYVNTSGASDFYLYCSGNAVDVYGIRVWHGEQVTISSVGYATLYYSDKAFEIPSGVTATIVTSVEGGKITFEELSEVIPAGTGVVLKGNEGTYNFAIATTQANAPENNLLKGSDEAATTTGGDLYYMLSLNANSDEGSVGFYWGDAEGGAFENGAHKAYLAVANSTDAKSFYLFEENTTGIDAVQGARLNAQDMEIYNLNGQRVMNARKGIYIVNGRKVVVK